MLVPVAQLESLGATDDREAEPEHDEDGADDEPSLGSHVLPSGAISYQQSKSFGEVDVEDEHDGREPDVDDEPSLGWTIGQDGVGSLFTDDRDLEADYADEEPSLGWCEASTSGDGGCHAGPAHDIEISAPAVTAAARERYLASKIDGGVSAGVRVEPNDACYGPQRLGGLSNRQREILKPKVNRREVIV